MSRFLTGILVVLMTLIGQVFPSQGAEMKRLLVVSTTTEFRHSAISTLEKTIAALGEKSGAFNVDFLQQPADGTSMETALQKLSPESLKNYDGVVFASTTGNLPIPDKAGFLDWIRAGHAFIGIHSASDTFHGWPEYREMLGGEFKVHHEQVSVTCRVVDKNHPATKDLGAEWKIEQEEIYLFQNYDPKNVHELLVLDRHPNDGNPGNYPIAWTREYGQGKVFYTALGHREDIVDSDPNLKDRKNPVEISQAYQKHLLGGILAALGVVK
ncbi:ThuA domain-containing protein [bacterium]|nr:MAG: ThuA domain-containing protein [bacterium]